MNVCHCQYLNKESLLFVFVFVFLSSVYTGCSSTPPSSAELNLEGNWQLHHLEGTKITVLAPDDEGLFVGTEAGLFQLNGTEIVPLGLGEHKIVGVVRLKTGELLASVREWVFGSGNPTLFKSTNEENWKPFMNNFGGEQGKYTQIGSGPLAAYPGSDTLFVTGFWLIRSEDAGKTWSIHADGGNGDVNVVETWNALGQSQLLYVDPHHKGRIWIGGINTLSKAYLFKYRDYGEYWVNVNGGLSPNVEAIAYDVVTHPDNPDWVLAGLGGAIAQANNVKKSTDGGQSWRMVLEETGIHAFARSLQNPLNRSSDLRHASTKLFFAYTSDFGETWQKEILEEGPDDVTTNSLAVQVIDGQEVLFLGTNKGVYSFQLN